MTRIFLVTLLSLVVAMAAAQEKGYKVVRPDGSVEYTDQPVPGAQEIVLPKSQGGEARIPAFTPTTSPAKPQQVVSYELTITTPEDDQTYHSGEGGVVISVSLEPGLQAGHRLVIVLDGEVVAENKTTIILSEVDRGSHTVAAEVRDEAGSVIAAATPVTFHRFQPSLLFPGRAPSVPPATPQSPQPAPEPTPTPAPLPLSR